MTDSGAATRFSVGLEQGADGAFLAHGLTLAGCAAPGATAEEAVAGFERALHEWLRFLAAAGERVPPADAELELAVDEWLATDAAVAAGETAACFAADLPALTVEEIDTQLRHLGQLRGALLARVKRFPAAVLDAESPGGWTARQVMEELARAGWWTLTRLGASPLGEAPESTLGRLDTSLALAVQTFAHMPPEKRGTRIELEGEEWTPRKVLRRLLYLEWTLGRAAASALAPPA
jgi:predicted RNase H-like HicB family nuclease